MKSCKLPDEKWGNFTIIGNAIVTWLHLGSILYTRCQDYDDTQTRLNISALLFLSVCRM